MTTTDIDAIRSREQAATPGPWVSNDGDVYAEDTGDLIAEGLDTDNPEQSRADAEFAAHARADVPALLARVDELEYAHQLQQRDLLGAIGDRDAAHATIREVLAMLERFDTPRDSSRVRVLVGDLKHITYKALTEAEVAR